MEETTAKLLVIVLLAIIFGSIRAMTYLQEERRQTDREAREYLQRHKRTTNQHQRYIDHV